MRNLSLLLGLLPVFTVLAAGSVVPRFSELQSLQNSAWQPLEFPKIKRHSRYRLAVEDGIQVVRADTDNSASGLIARKRIDTESAAVIEWRWKVSNIYDKGDAGTKSGDDYPARIYVAFAFEPERAGFFEKARRAAAGVFYEHEIPGTAINYIWANRLEAGRIVANAFSEQTKMIAVDSGGENTGSWISRRRNIIADYREAFGHDPPAIIGIGIMSDSDNTGESASAWYGDIILKKE